MFATTMNWTFWLHPRMDARIANFPNWSWAGWRFGEAGVGGGEWFMPRYAVHYPRSSSDYVVKWYEVGSAGQYRLVNDEPFTLSSYSDRDAPLLTEPRAGHIYENPALPLINSSSDELNIPQLMHMLRFWAVGAYLTVSREPEPREHPLWKLLPPDKPIDSYRIYTPDYP